MNAKQARTKTKKNIRLNSRVTKAIEKAIEAGLTDIMFYEDEISNQDVSALKLLGYEVVVSSYVMRYRKRLTVTVSW